MIVLLLVGMSTCALNIHSVGAIPTTIIVPDNYPTIQGAINAASDGDTIFVKNGTYAGSLSVDKALTLVGENKNSTIINGANGILASFVNNVTVSGFTIQCPSSNYGIRLHKSSNNNVSGNVFVNCGLRVGYSNGNIVEDNLVNGKPLIYLEDKSDLIINHDAGQALLVNCDRILVENLSLSQTDAGIQLWNTNNSNIANNSITNSTSGIEVLSSSNSNNIHGNNVLANSYCGIYLFQSSNNTIVANNAMNNAECGIELDTSSGNAVSGNNISGNYGIGLLLWDGSSSNRIEGNNITENASDGIVLWGYYPRENTISGNDIKNNSRGIRLGPYIDDNIIVGNNISESKYSAFWIDEASDNRIFHNNVLNNNAPVYIEGPSFNTWDDGYPSGGNYWSPSYTGTDLFNGPFQNIAGSDGIGDSHYIIDAYNLDHYPLMNPYGSPPSLTYNLTIIMTLGGTTNPASGTYTYVNGSSINVTAVPGMNYTFDHWELDTANVGSTNPYTILMNSDRTLKAVFVHVPPLEVSISPVSASIYLGQSVIFTSTTSGGTPPYSYQWYLNGSAVSGATSSNWTFALQPIGNYNVYLNVTDNLGNTVESNQASVSVASQLAISISPMSASIHAGGSVNFTSTVSGGYPPYSYQWYLNNNPVSSATSASWTFTSTTSGIYYIHLKVTDAKANTAQSETARITAPTVPVGGYSYQTQVPTKTEPLLTYIALMSVLTVVFTKLKPKTKRTH